LDDRWERGTEFLDVVGLVFVVEPLGSVKGGFVQVGVFLFNPALDGSDGIKVDILSVENGVKPPNWSMSRWASPV